MMFNKAFGGFLFLMCLVLVSVLGCYQVIVTAPTGESETREPTSSKPELKIFRHVHTTLSEEDADTILKVATDVAQSNPGCNVTLTGDGDVKEFKWPQEADVGVVSSKHDFDKVTNSRGVKVVKDVQWCETLGPFWGCARIPGTAMVVERIQDKDSEGILWLHEYGHTQGLYDLYDDSQENNVLFHIIGPDHKRFSPNEC
jgi:hypothetical protein